MNRHDFVQKSCFMIITSNLAKTFMDFHRSAKELLTLRKKLTQSQMPCRSGPKDSLADGSEEQSERLEYQLEQLEEVLSEERVLRKGNISVGKWNSEQNLVDITVAKGVHWNVFGRSVQGHLVLDPEEALYMLDHGMLELYHNDLPVSVQQAYEILLSERFQLHHYAVYSYLRNLGFIVLRYERRDVNGGNITKSTKSEELLELGVDMDDECSKKAAKNVESVTEGAKEEQKGITIENELVETEQNFVEGESKMTVDENNPVSHYWKEKECRPLVQPGDAVSLESILKKLQVIKGQTRLEASRHENISCQFQIVYDVFQPQKNFRKSDPGLPNYSICVCKFSEPPPSIGEMNFMASQSHPVPLKYAVVDGKDVSFYSVFDVELPTYVEK